MAAPAPGPAPLPPLALLLTPRMQAAFKAVRAATPPDERSDDYRAVAAAFNSTPPDGSPGCISLPQLQLLSSLYRSTLAAGGAGLPASPLSAAAVSAAASPGRGFVHELALGSRPCPLPPAPRRRRSPEFERYLSELRVRAERREYAALVRDLPGSRAADAESASESVGSGFASASRDVGYGVNILTLMATGFAVCYYAGRGLFPHSAVYQALSGLLGLLAALMVEVGLFLTREGKAELAAAQQQRRQQHAHAAQPTPQQAQAERERARRRAQEMERRRRLLEEANRGGGAGEEKLD